MSGHELPKPINLSHPSWAGDDPRRRGLRIRAAGTVYLYIQGMLNLDPSCKLVEVMAMRECAFVGADPQRRSEPVRETLRSGSGPKQWARDRPINYMSGPSLQHLPFHSEANSTL